MHELIVDHRRQLAEILGTLTDDQWNEPSLCEGWRVRHVVAHITMPFRYSTPRFMIELARSGGRFHAMADRVARRDGARPTDELLDGLRRNVESPWTPPGGGEIGALTHDVIHGLDITAALGIERPCEPGRMRLVLDNLTGPASLRHFGVSVDGIELRANDLDWSAGSGSPLEATATDLALVLTGRRCRAGRPVRERRRALLDGSSVMTTIETPPLEADELSLIFGALADSTRRSILARLTEGDATGVVLAEPFGISQQGIAKHLKVLERAGLISRTRTAQSRTCRLEPARLDGAADWIARNRQVWSDRFDRLDEHLQSLRTTNPPQESTP